MCTVEHPCGSVISIKLLCGITEVTPRNGSISHKIPEYFYKINFRGILLVLATNHLYDHYDFIKIRRFLQ